MMVFKFGVRKILDGSGSAHAEMRTAAYLFNALVAVERWRRKEYAAIRSRYVPGLSEVEAAYEQLSEWIGEHAGPGGERGEIRSKRQRASAPKKRGDKAHPTKQVNVVEEIDAISELKSWRKAASEAAAPLRATFDSLTDRPNLVYEARTRGVAIEELEERNRLYEIAVSCALKTPEAKAARRACESMKERIDAASRKTHKKKAANAQVLEEMLSEPEWHEAWKECARLDATAYWLRNSWVGDAHTLNHGTYQAVEDDVVRAGKRPKSRPDGEPRRPRQRPAFSRTRLRKMGWQVQGGVSWGDVLAGKCRDLKIDTTHPKGTSGHRWVATMRIRITQPDGVSTWVTLETSNHRPIPDDTKIVMIYLVPEERQGGRWEYSVQLTAAPTAPLIKRAVGSGHVHVSLRWTQYGDTLDVADINGTSLLLPGQRSLTKGRVAYGIVPSLRYADSLRGFADKHFDEARSRLVERLDKMPDDVQEMCANITNWRRHEPLRRVSNTLAGAVGSDMDPNPTLGVWHRWRAHRLKSQVDLFVSFEEFSLWCRAHGPMSETLLFSCWLETWRHKDEHLAMTADGVRRRAIAARRDFYKMTAARLSEQHETCSLGGAIDLQALALRDKSEDRPKELHRAARHNRTLAAVSELKEALKDAFSERLRDAPEVGGARSSEKDADSDSGRTFSGAAE